jgi:membrane-bound lytic murein transglycosylase B
VLLAGCAGTPPPETGGQDDSAAFRRFCATFEHGLPARQARIFEAAFEDGFRPYRPALKSVKAQPESTKSFEDYVGPMLKAERVATARQKLAENREVLERIGRRTGVPPEVVVALWGIETSFGKAQGTHPVIPALATLAWQSNRPDFYARELHAALTLVEKNHLTPDIKGSWAGAVGQPQFMPSTYLRAGVDGDGDGVVDLFDDLPDVFASAAHLLQQNGWRPGLAWRVPVSPDMLLPGNLKLNERGLSAPFAISGTGLAEGVKYRYYRPTNGPGFLLGPNFEAVLKWNNSSYFAYSVLTLAEMLEG